MGERINYLLPCLWYINAIMLRLYTCIFLNYFAIN
jgi:hypothetical protein